jgi:uncharacterized protein (TIGR02246 family)
MRAPVGAVLLVFACVGRAFAQTTSPAAKAPSVSQTVMQLERDWLDAEKAGDGDKVSQILADDWKGVYGDGSKLGKQEFVESVRSGAMKIESFEIAPMQVKVMGNVAVVQGGDTEKSSNGGKDTSGKWIWMDVFVNRDGKWAAVRSQTVLVK